ncbi:MAG: hypothetical protein FWG61_00945, partial [Firmicutes bacterium]|nr:hypothetical protein [Bacillota bacterium]
MAEVVEKTAFLDDRAVAAKLSEEAMNRLIEDFKPFLKGCVAKYSRRYDENQRDELFSSAMLAFFEAIKSYDAAKGHFFPFANRVVNKRIIDHIRKIYRQEGKTVSFDETNAEQQSAQSAA